MDLGDPVREIEAPAPVEVPAPESEPVAQRGSRMTDADFLLALLADGKPRTTNEILAASFAERGVGLTVHSRAADLRRKGHVLVVTPEGKRDGRNVFSYRLLPSLREAEAGTSGAAADAGFSASRSEGDDAPSGAGSSCADGPALSLFETPTKPAWA